MQISSADFVLINKSDLARPGQVDEVMRWIECNFPDKPSIAISAKTGENLDKLYEMMK